MEKLRIALDIFGGLGLFFIGMRLLSTHLKDTAGNRVRLFAARVARRRSLMMLVGTSAGIATQSTNAVTAAATGLATAHILSIREAFPLIACANIGTSLLVYLAAVDLHLEVLFAAGVCGVLYYLKFDQSPRHRAPIGALLALTLILFGLDLIGQGAVGLRGDPELQAIFGLLSGMPVAAFVVGAALVPVLQTAKTVAVVVALLAQSGVLGPVEAIAAVIGANLTSAANVAALTSGVSPMGRALGYYQAILKFIGSVLAIIALLVTLAVSPGLFAGIDPANAPYLVATAYLIMQTAAYAVSMAFEGPISARLTHMVQRRTRDDPNEPRYISREALNDPATATELAFKEHLDIMAGLSAELDEVRQDRPAETMPRRDGAAIGRALAEFLDALSGQTNDEAVRRRVGSLRRLHNLAMAMHPLIRGLAANAARSGSDSEVVQPMEMMVESAHMLLDLFGSACQSGDAEDRLQVLELTSDRTPVTEQIRLAVMSRQAADAEGARTLFDSCIAFERIIWLIRRYLLLTDEPGSPYRDDGSPSAAAGN
ncbi:transporter [Allostella vacuolata]|nr:transporter [Stella vacuolata]